MSEETTAEAYERGRREFSEPCPRWVGQPAMPCPGTIRDRLAKDSSCYECQACDGCGATWWYEPPKSLEAVSPQSKRDREQREMMAEVKMKRGSDRGVEA